MTLQITATDLHLFNMRTRMPFKYGIASMTALPHVFARVHLTVDGQTQAGLASDHLPPKWFTKNPDTPFEDDLAEMLDVIQTACRLAEGLPSAATVFELWESLYASQKAWAADTPYPPLLWAFGVSLVERAMIDAFCRAGDTPFAAAVRENSLGVRLEAIHPELAGASPADFLPAQPNPTLIARHTVGLADYLTDDDIPLAERLDDGLPQSLAAVIRAYGQTHFKLKLFGHPERDVERLAGIAAVIEESGVRDYAFTLDGNENYRELGPFRILWQRLSRDPSLAAFMDHLLFVEQPLHREVALSEETRTALAAWVERPPIIIDESDGSLDGLPLALSGGYAGTSHKNCKGVFKGIANACLVTHRRRLNPGRPYLLSGEDLSNVGPVALLQDCTVMAVLGVDHAERNSHHYFTGLSMFPRSIQEAVLEHHSDLYHRHPHGYPTLTIEQGRIAIGSLLAAPFGPAFPLDPTIFTPVDEWEAAL